MRRIKIAFSGPRGRPGRVPSTHLSVETYKSRKYQQECRKCDTKFCSFQSDNSPFPRENPGPLGADVMCENAKLHTAIITKIGGTAEA